MDISFWRDISIIFIIVETVVLILVPLVLTFLMVRGSNWLHGQIRTLLQMTRARTAKIPGYVEQGSLRIAEPVISTRRRLRKIESTLQGLRSSSGIKSRENQIE